MISYGERLVKGSSSTLISDTKRSIEKIPGGIRVQGAAGTAKKGKQAFENHFSGCKVCLTVSKCMWR